MATRTATIALTEFVETIAAAPVKSGGLVVVAAAVVAGMVGCISPGGADEMVETEEKETGGAGWGCVGEAFGGGSVITAVETEGGTTTGTLVMGTLVDDTGGGGGGGEGEDVEVVQGVVSVIVEVLMMITVELDVTAVSVVVG